MINLINKQTNKLGFYGSLYNSWSLAIGIFAMYNMVYLGDAFIHKNNLRFLLQETQSYQALPHPKQLTQHQIKKMKSQLNQPPKSLLISLEAVLMKLRYGECYNQTDSCTPTLYPCLQLAIHALELFLLLSSAFL